MASAEGDSLLRTPSGSYNPDPGISSSSDNEHGYSSSFPYPYPYPYAVNAVPTEGKYRNPSAGKRDSDDRKTIGCCKGIGCRRGCYIACIASTSFVFLASVVVMILSFVVTSRTVPLYPFPTEEPATIPSAPRPPTLVETGIESLIISWNEPDLNSAVLRSYEVQYSWNGTNFATHHPGPGINRFYEVTELIPSSLYRFRVRAINTLGPGNFSDPSLSFPTLNPTAPGPPTRPRIMGATRTSLTVSWEMGTKNGATTTGSELEIALYDGSNQDPDWQNHPVPDDLHFTVNDLEMGGNYIFRIRTMSLEGPSPWSENVTYHTNMENSTNPAFPFPLILDTLTCNSIYFRWARPDDRGSEILYYEITLKSQKTNQTYSYTSLRNISGTREEVTATGLEFATRHVTNVVTYNALGKSLPATAFLYTTRLPSAPEMPKPPYVVHATPTTISLEWDEPDLNCDPIMAYSLEQDDWWSDRPFFQVYQGPQRNFTLVDLVPAVTYNFRVTAENNYGFSAVSYMSSFTTFNRGSCGNQGDISAVKSNFDVIPEVIQSCLIRCAIGGTECALVCIMNDIGLSEACAFCWVSMGQCTLEQCSIECLHPKSSNCARCTEEKCVETTVECTGMPAWALPR